MAIILITSISLNSQDYRVPRPPDPCEGDQICHYLSTSKNAYINANIGDAVFIEGDEFALVTSNLGQINHDFSAGYSFSNYTVPPNDFVPNSTLSPGTNGTVNGRPYAFRYYKYDAPTTTGAKIKISDSQTTGFTDYITLPPHSGVGIKSFVIKRAADLVGTKYIAIYSPETIRLRGASVSMNWCNTGDCATLDLANPNFAPLFVLLTLENPVW